MFTAKSLLLFLFALLQAIVAVLIAEHWVAGKSASNVSAPAVEQVHYAKVVVASRDIPQWQKLDASYLKEVEWPEKAVASDGDRFTEISQVVGQVAIAPIYSGEAANKKRLRDPKDGSVFSLLIPENKRALTVRVNDVSGVAGFLQPGSRVDVLATTGKVHDITPGLGAAAERHAETIVRDIKVLAIDQDANNDEDKPQIVRSVTLEMTQQEAESVFKAEEGGSIRLALRNPSIETPLTDAGAVLPRAPASPTDAYERTFTIIRRLDASESKCNRFTCSE
jgi:pilus assembly protein CpaB